MPSRFAHRSFIYGKNKLPKAPDRRYRNLRICDEPPRSLKVSLVHTERRLVIKMNVNKIAQLNQSGRKNILYFSCHQILEFDDMRMLTDAGHTVFSIGDYSDPSAGPKLFRSPLPQFFQLELLKAFNQTGCDWANKRVTREFANLFDLVIVNHYSEWVTANLDSFGSIPVILRTIGQSRRPDERAYAALGSRVVIVRYSPREAEAPGFAATAAVIRFAKYADDYPEWTGRAESLTFHNNFVQREHIACPTPSMWRLFQARTASKLYGNGNEMLSRSNGLAKDSEMSDLLRQASSYFYIYTTPPSYTLSLMEAMLAGCPIIAPSAALINKVVAQDYEDAWSVGRYEVPDLLKDGSGVVYATIAEAVYASHWLQASHEAGLEMSRRVVRAGREAFDVESVYPQWDKLFSSVC